MAETFICPGCTQIGRVYDDAVKQANSVKAPTMGIKVRLLSREEMLARRRKAAAEAKKKAMERGPLP